jgi:hypothetical protein
MKNKFARKAPTEDPTESEFESIDKLDDIIIADATEIKRRNN